MSFQQGLATLQWCGDVAEFRLFWEGFRAPNEFHHCGFWGVNCYKQFMDSIVAEINCGILWITKPWGWFGQAPFRGSNEMQSDGTQKGDEPQCPTCVLKKNLPDPICAKKKFDVSDPKKAQEKSKEKAWLCRSDSLLEHSKDVLHRIQLRGVSFCQLLFSLARQDPDQWLHIVIPLFVNFLDKKEWTYVIGGVATRAGGPPGGVVQG